VKLLIKLLVLVLVVFFGVGLLLPTEYGVTREIVIDAPPEQIHDHLDDFRSWLAWSPFHAEDPDMELTYTGPESGVGHKQDWESETIGDGSIEILESDPTSGLTYRLWFGDTDQTARSRIAFEPVEDGTKVVWSMSGDAAGSILGRWFGLMMDSLVGPSYEEGLASLKTVVEQEQQG